MHRGIANIRGVRRTDHVGEAAQSNKSLRFGTEQNTPVGVAIVFLTDEALEEVGPALLGKVLELCP